MIVVLVVDHLVLKPVADEGGPVVLVPAAGHGEWGPDDELLVARHVHPWGDVTLEQNRIIKLAGASIGIRGNFRL